MMDSLFPRPPNLSDRELHAWFFRLLDALALLSALPRIGGRWTVREHRTVR